MNSGKLTKTILCLMVVALLAPGLLMAATGKIRGTVVDAETKAPLFGANVVLEGSTMGAATNVNGEYIILNVPAGVYSVTVMYMGYAKTTHENVVVAEGLTTFHDFELGKAVLEGQEVVIVAERPLIEKGETNEVQRITGEDLANMPLRGVNNAVNNMAGVVADGGNTHVRGGRAGEMAYYVDGVNVTRPRADDNDNQLIIQNAVELVQTQTGGFDASYGGKMSGITQTTMKSGGPKYQITGEVISDEFWAVKDDRGAYEILGMDEVYSYGYNDYILTLSGPVVPGYDKIRFFAAGQLWDRASNATWFEGFHQDSLEVPYQWTNRTGGMVRDTTNLYLDVAPGRQPGYRDIGRTLNSNLVFDFKPFRVRVGMNYAFARFRSESSDLPTIYEIRERPRINDRTTWTTYLNLTHAIDPTAFYTLSASYYNRFSEDYDSKFKDDLMSYGDPVANPALVDRSLTREYSMPFGDIFSFNYPGLQQSSWYVLNKEERYTFKFDMTKQFGQNHQAQAGFEFQKDIIRRYQFRAAAMYNRLYTTHEVTQDEEGNPVFGDRLANFTEFDVYFPLVGLNIGYDMYGNEVDDSQTMTTLQGVDVDGEGNPIETAINLRNKPMTPLMMSGYLKDDIELKDMILNLSVRIDHFRNGIYSIKDMSALTQAAGTTISDDDFGPEKQYTYVSPRIGFSFPVTETAQFHAQYGKYVQPVNTDWLWGISGPFGIANQIFNAPFFDPQPNPNLKPEKTTSFEFGFQMQFGMNAALDLTAYYKDTRDLLTIRKVLPSEGAGYSPADVYTNGDYGTIRGFTANFNMRRTSRIQTNVMYTYTVAQGTGSTPDSHQDIAWQESTPMFPKIIQTLDFDVRHKATAVLDIRTQPDDGPELFGVHPFGNLGANFTFNVTSGLPYTAIGIADNYSYLQGFNGETPLGTLNSDRMPWRTNLDAQITKGFKVGPVDMTAYLWVLNVFNTKGVTNVFATTGSPDTDGWLLTTLGKAAVAQHGEIFEKWYNATLTNCGTFGYQAPRQIRFGLRFAI